MVTCRCSAAGTSRPSENIKNAMPATPSVIQPSVPLWTWLMSTSCSGSQTSMPFRIPITIVYMKIDAAAVNVRRAAPASPARGANTDMVKPPL